MKRAFTIMAMVMMAVMMTAVFATAADSVDIGMGRMDRSEFNALQQMVRGDFRPTQSVTTEIPQVTHVAEFNVRDVESIRQAMVGNRDQEMVATSASPNKLVDIGLGSMSTNEFCDLNKLVASNTTQQNEGFEFICP